MTFEMICVWTIQAFGLALFWVFSAWLVWLGAQTWKEAVIDWIDNLKTLKGNTRPYLLWRRILRRQRYRRWKGIGR